MVLTEVVIVIFILAALIIIEPINTIIISIVFGVIFYFLMSLMKLRITNLGFKSQY